ncbi:hypothetical protein BGZ60DRAFT_428630 [Tricladium varicosporioides]|nr:hypothetical protein BGZ60DRAFT_428630 [Hymenoscyphus varicosporioides]
MPYNTTAIPPRREPTGTAQLPLSRVKKIINLDPDVDTVTSSATFVIALATEMFIQHMAEQGHNVVKSERKPRRNIQYRDLSNAIARLDNLEFLTDVVPRTIPFKEVKTKKAPALGGPARLNGDSDPAQTTLDGISNNTNAVAAIPVLNGTPTENGTNGFGHGRGRGSIDEESIADPNMQLERESRGAARMSTGSTTANVGEDVEMS